jgi:hypothetical protein
VVTRPRDPTLDVLLDLDGQVLVVDPDGGHWVRFVVTLVPVSPEKPHGIDYPCMARRASGWSGSTMPIRLPGRGAASRWTIATGYGRSGLMNTRT